MCIRDSSGRNDAAGACIAVCQIGGNGETTTPAHLHAEHALVQMCIRDRPADVCFARGTFNSHPYVMGAMAEFLDALDGEPIQALYRNLGVWDTRATALNERLSAAGLPVRVTNLSSIWTIGYAKPSRYNWMFQYYLRAAGLALSLSLIHI